MPIFKHARLLDIYEAALSAGLIEERAALLAGLEPGFVAALPSSFSDRAAQLLSDLGVLNGVEAVASGTLPIAVWLQNAQLLAAPRAAARVFEAALSEVRRR